VNLKPISATHVTDPIRTACRAVAERAGFVKIDFDRIPTYAASLAVAETSLSELEPGYHFLGREADTVAFLITLGTVNFGSGYFPHLRKRPGKSGYFSIAGALNDYYVQHGPLSTDALTTITVEDCAGIFAQDPDNEPIRELLRHFTTALNDLGGYLTQNFGGSFTALVHAAEASVDKLIRFLIQMPYFKDVHRYGRLEVPFYKRAQLTAADLSLAFRERGFGRFEDLNRLTIFADNLVPHVLRMDRILTYHDHLAQRVAAAELIPAGSPEEIEIRGCAVHAVECIKHEMQRSGHRVTSRELDHLLWNRGQQPFYKAVRRHRTRTVYY
jgi:hypothetical protein